MQATLRAPNLFITFFLILLAVVQPLLAAPVEITKDTQCSGGKECIKEADNVKFHAANTVKSKYIPRSAPTTNTRKLKKRSQLATQLKKRAVLAPTMVVLKILAILSASTLVVAPPPGLYSRYKPQNQNQNQNQPDSNSSGGTNTFRSPVVIPATPVLSENPNPISANIQLNSDYSMSQYSPSEGSRDINLELATVQFPSGGQNSGFSLSPMGTPRSSRRPDSRFPTPKQKKAGIKYGTVRKKHIHWDGDENVDMEDAPEDELAYIPTTIQMLGMPYSARGPKPTYRDPVVMTTNWGSLSQGRGDSEDVDDDDSSIDANFLENRDEEPVTDQVLSYRPGLTPRVQIAMASRGGQY
ncbi:hypothetical protein EYR41_001086 [Orbilia oligospora]|uniref:Uncharacterized protein n=1 Tax=Orbilia oligospora TaxID=2813651 RepID=A0A8H2EDV9_ORBOL|nr:hypothetical protein EYR41_001086 [Orbilia oligospora]